MSSNKKILNKLSPLSTNLSLGFSGTQKITGKATPSIKSSVTVPLFTNLDLKKILISIMKDQNLEPSEALTLSIINRIHMFNSQIRCFIMRNSKRKGTKKRRKNGFSKK